MDKFEMVTDAIIVLVIFLVLSLFAITQLDSQSELESMIKSDVEKCESVGGRLVVSGVQRLCVAKHKFYSNN